MAQAVVLNANGPGNTYELINSVLAPGFDVVENPECVHGSFGRHIAEVWDADLGTNVFEFYSHVAQDNDRCINFDRQRVEIKTYDKSPANLIGVLGETITYKWKFRIPVGFKPSSNFTHIHQIKPVNGDDGDPLFTLTARKGSPNKLELIHNNTTKLVIVNLSLFEGQWVEATEVVKVGAAGTYSMLIKRLSDNATLISYSNANLLTIRPDNDFIRPKWGIYRSLLNAQDLRDDSIRFNGFSIEEGEGALSVKWLDFKASDLNGQIVLKWKTASEINNKQFIAERSSNGFLFEELGRIPGKTNSLVENRYEFYDGKPLSGRSYYRIKQVDFSGAISYSSIAVINHLFYSDNKMMIFPNPVNQLVRIRINHSEGQYVAVVRNTSGIPVLSYSGTVEAIGNSLSLHVQTLDKGLYTLSIFNEKENYTSKFFKN